MRIKRCTSHHIPIDDCVVLFHLAGDGGLDNGTEGGVGNVGGQAVPASI